jgi:DNA polymerase I-like protein with 3'-5' exonuclease and polymerase domains
MAKVKVLAGQQPLWAPKSDWKPPCISDLPDWSRFKRVGYDVETKDPCLSLQGVGPGYFRGIGHVAGFGFACEGGGSYYLPVRHEGGGNMDLQEVLRYMRGQAATFCGELVGANLPYDCQWSRTDGIMFKPAMYRDVQIAEPLIDELQMSMALEDIGERRNIDAKHEDLLNDAAEAFNFAGKDYKDVKKNLHKLHSKYVGEYCARDAGSPLEILRSQEIDINKYDLWAIWNLESKVLPVLMKYAQRGVLIDQDKLEQIEKWAFAQASEALKIVRSSTGIEVDVKNVWKKGALIPVFAKLGIHMHVLKVNKKGQKDFQIDQALFHANKELPAVKAIAWARKVSKLLQFAGQVRTTLCPDGRIHCKINQIAMENEDGEQAGARFGRTSCMNPNLQQQPSRDEFAKEWRSIYIANPGCIWGCLDYSQQEPRWVTHFAKATYVQPGSEMAKQLKFAGHLKGAAEACQAYWDNPLLDNHTFMAELTGLKRSHAKIVYLGICYGEGGAKLCHDLGLPTAWAVSVPGRGQQKFQTQDEAMEYCARAGIKPRYWECAGEEGQKILDTMDTRAPFIRQLSNVCKYMAETRGWVRTAGGRILHFPRRADGSFDWAHKALNRVIQGTSADQNKAAMVAIDEQEPDAFIQLPVHDEIDGSFVDIAQARRCKKIAMECMGQTNVPFRVDDEYGANWGYIEAAA